ncbi:development/cell death domain-containing protein [Tanacetum coccineum]
MSNSETIMECLDRKLFGLPYNMLAFVLSVKKGMLLFLFEFKNILLFVVLRVKSDGEINIHPRAYKKKFPAQVRFTTVWDCNPLAKHDFRDAIKDNYYSVKKFKFGLNQDEVYMCIYRTFKVDVRKRSCYYTTWLLLQLCSDKNVNPPGIIKDEEVDALPPIFIQMIKRMVRWHVLPPTCVPNSCMVNIYDKDLDKVNSIIAPAWKGDHSIMAERKRISHKRTKNKAKNDKTEHGMERCEKTKPNRSQKVNQAKKSKSKSTPTKSSQLREAGSEKNIT